MQLAFCLFKVFPYGGLQRDFLRVALSCQARGHAIRVYTLEWRGDRPAGFDIRVLSPRALRNSARYEKFARQVAADLHAHPVDRVIGFNKMPGLDFYYAADPCYAHKALNQRPVFYRWSARYRHFARFERAVFAAQSSTRILLIAPAMQALFMAHYQTPAARFHVLPPGIAADRRAPADAAAQRAALRRELALADTDLLLLLVGSGFKTKGLDRALKALAALPPGVRQRTRLLAIGDDDPRPFLRQSRALGLAAQVNMLKGRDDIPRFLLAADLLIHPAYSEAAGMVLLEAAVAGLPVLTTAVCGYAHYIETAQAGEVLSEPFVQEALDARLAALLDDPATRQRYAQNGLRFAAQADIYGLPERAADIILGPR